MTKIQGRDRRLLKLCYEQKFLTLEHVEREFEPAGSVQANRRILELERSGLLRRALTLLPGRKYTIELTPQGRNVARNESPYTIHSKKSGSLGTLVHDSIVTSVRQRLERVWIGEFVPELAIRERPLQPLPDGYFKFPSGKQVAIEVENSAKWRVRFLSLARRWRRVEGVFFVLYVATSSDLAAMIKKLLTELNSDQPMGLVLWDELKNGYPLVWTPRGDLKLFEWKEF